MRVVLFAAMLALAGLGLVALVAEPAAAEPPCDLNLRDGSHCCIYWRDDNLIYWEEC